MSALTTELRGWLADHLLSLAISIGGAQWVKDAVELFRTGRPTERLANGAPSNPRDDAA